jgi:hypothetical protein
MIFVASISDNAERRVIRYLSALSKLLPFSKIANAMIEYYKSR